MPASQPQLSPSAHLFLSSSIFFHFFFLRRLHTRTFFTICHIYLFLLPVNAMPFSVIFCIYDSTSSVISAMECSHPRHSSPPQPASMKQKTAHNSRQPPPLLRLQTAPIMKRSSVYYTTAASAIVGRFISVPRLPPGMNNPTPVHMPCTWCSL